MPKAWSKKDERQFSHVKESALNRGKTQERAEQIAGRVVNQTRRQQGRTTNQTTQGTGNPNTQLEQRTANELYNIAKELEIEGRSKMKKAELIEAIRNAR